MTRFVALFHAINVGKAKRIAMADLRALLESLGYTDVKPLLRRQMGQDDPRLMHETCSPASIPQQAHAVQLTLFRIAVPKRIKSGLCLL